jgi:hypothetical protein
VGKGSGLYPFEANVHHPVDDGDLMFRRNELIFALKTIPGPAFADVDSLWKSVHGLSETPVGTNRKDQIDEAKWCMECTLQMPLPRGTNLDFRCGVA